MREQSWGACIQGQSPAAAGRGFPFPGPGAAIRWSREAGGGAGGRGAVAIQARSQRGASAPGANTFARSSPAHQFPAAALRGKFRPPARSSQLRPPPPAAGWLEEVAAPRPVLPRVLLDPGQGWRLAPAPGPNPAAWVRSWRDLSPAFQSRGDWGPGEEKCGAMEGSPRSWWGPS